MQLSPDFSSVFGGVKVWANLERSFKKRSISSESLILHINGLTLSAKRGFCER